MGKCGYHQRKKYALAFKAGYRLLFRPYKSFKAARAQMRPANAAGKSGKKILNEQKARIFALSKR
ncbi:MAG: hypothetical protein QMD09_15165, partial [Desulfatibacillaceae bacterium]|nr:hypothetical protein [Desulfatibacillaceae bacterium]